MYKRRGDRDRTQNRFSCTVWCDRYFGGRKCKRRVIRGREKVEVREGLLQAVISATGPLELCETTKGCETEIRGTRPEVP